METDRKQHVHKAVEDSAGGKSFLLELYDRLRKLDPTLVLLDLRSTPRLIIEFTTERPRLVRSAIEACRLETERNVVRHYHVSLSEALQRLKKQGVPEPVLWELSQVNESVINLTCCGDTLFWFPDGSGDDLQKTLRINGPYPRYIGDKLSWFVTLQPADDVPEDDLTSFWRELPGGPALTPKGMQELQHLQQRHAQMMAKAGFEKVAGVVGQKQGPFAGLSGQVIALSAELPVRRWQQISTDYSRNWLPEMGLYDCPDELDLASILLEPIQLPLVLGDLAGSMRDFLHGLNVKVEACLRSGKQTGDHGDIRSCLRMMSRLAGWTLDTSTLDSADGPSLELLLVDRPGRRHSGPFIRINRHSGILALDHHLQEKELCEVQVSFTGGWRRLLAMSLEWGRGRREVQNSEKIFVLAASRDLNAEMDQFIVQATRCGLFVERLAITGSVSDMIQHCRRKTILPLVYMTASGAVMISEEIVRLPEDPEALCNVLRDLK